MLTLAEKLAQREVEKTNAYARGVRQGKAFLAGEVQGIVATQQAGQNIAVYRAYCEGLRNTIGDL